ncbi:hypothetical protein BJ742DRAFT_21895 [Cladochytrium replicatum]|nr:hypothetical protein BJ742DRAFT_21895 [Cladochytrium replicatum]
MFVQRLFLVPELRNVQTEVHGKLAQIDLSDPNTYTNGLVARKALFDFVARLDKMHPSSADSSVVTRAKSSALAQAGLSYWITGDVNSARDLALRAINTLKNGTSEARKQNPLAAALLHSHDLMAGADDAADNTSSYDDLLKFCRDMVPEQEERAILTEEVAWAISTKILEAERIANIAATRAIDSLNDGDPWGDKAFASALPFLRLAADAGSRAAALAVTYTFAGRSSIAVTSQNGEQSALTKGKSSNIGHRNWGLARSMANVIGLDAFIPMLIALADRGDVESQLALARYTADGVPKSLNVFASFNEPTETSTFRSKAISSFKAIRQLVLDAENEKAEEATQHAAFEIYSQAAHLAESRISEARTSTRVARLEVARRLRFGIGTDANPSNALKIYRSLSREFFPVGVEQIGMQRNTYYVPRSRVL